MPQYSSVIYKVYLFLPICSLIIHGVYSSKKPKNISSVSEFIYLVHLRTCTGSFYHLTTALVFQTGIPDLLVLSDMNETEE